MPVCKCGAEFTTQNFLTLHQERKGCIGTSTGGGGKPYSRLGPVDRVPVRMKGKERKKKKFSEEDFFSDLTSHHNPAPLGAAVVEVESADKTVCCKYCNRRFLSREILKHDRNCDPQR